ncbi:nucleoside monophosphate kinase [Calothrix sp. FACHB-1219]|uniref:adenylate kinase family protein n=1 Tax=unclassified Calothrix TaxID=2619626 RepID=UPI00168A0356|nr:nucleoside monophosphate kinase [Calothrix sp. FACHB-168]MBD2205378.1 nucleoside monophosphate kinase [Calothrix sp. FACHB-168]MBD2218509.1 nucleoside monophosphate kinase [Calothrix sp. FACHB-1219]
MRLVILGGSGSGKSTQAEKLCRYFEIPKISTGEILREAISVDSPSFREDALQSSVNNHMNNLGDLGRYAQPYVETGELVPDEMMIELIQMQLTKLDSQSGWILEGYPRTAFQAEELDFLLEYLGQKLNWAIYLQVPEAIMVNRCLGRSLKDEQSEIVQRRIELFYDRTIPILEYYDRRRRLLTINGDQSRELVHQQIVNLLAVH